MDLRETRIAGVYVIEPEPFVDERGAFARTFCAETFAVHGLVSEIAQASYCVNHHRGTIRGLHYQTAPASETKIVRCTRGAVLDVVVDARLESATYLEHVAVELSGANHRALYVPAGFAHGYQVLEDDTEMHYQMSTPYSPGHERGFRYDDPAIGIDWPLSAVLVSDKDRALPLLPRPVGVS